MDFLIVTSFIIEIAESEIWFQMHQIDPINQADLLIKYSLTLDNFTDPAVKFYDFDQNRDYSQMGYFSTSNSLRFSNSIICIVLVLISVIINIFEG